MMFKNLIDFSYKRSFFEAVGFYLAYFFAMMLLTIAITGVLSLVVTDDTFNFGKIGVLSASVASPVLCLLILRAKRLEDNLLFQIISGFSAILAYYYGATISFIPIAFFTTLKSASN